MAEYEELVELGFEGVDRFATHLHDPVVGFVSKHRPFSSRSKKHEGRPPAGQQGKERQRELPEEDKPPPPQDSPQAREPPEQPYLPPHPQWQVPPPPPGAPPAGLPYPGRQPTGLPSPPGQPLRRQLPLRGEQYGSRSVPGDIGELDSDSDGERGPKSMYSSYAPDRRRDEGRRGDERYERTVEDREYYGSRGKTQQSERTVDDHEYYGSRGMTQQNERTVEGREYDGPSRTAQQMAVRNRDANKYQGALVARAPSLPPDYGYARRGPADGWAVRGRPPPRRQRSSSWSAPRRPERRHASPTRRVRSKSPNHHRALAVVVGALVGGVAGSRVKKGDAVPNTVATVGGAILGGIAAREAEQEYDRHKERRAQQTHERGEARERRRLERDHNYD